MKGQACSFFDPKGGAFEFTARIVSVGMNFMAKRAVSDLYFPSFAIVTPMGVSDSDAVPFSHFFKFYLRPSRQFCTAYSKRTVRGVEWEATVASDIQQWEWDRIGLRQDCYGT